MTTASNGAWCAIDFGTSNSAVAVPAADGGSRLVELEAGAPTMPTAVFYFAEHAPLPPGAPPPSAVGRAAIAAYVDGYEGRLMRSMKSILGSPLVEQSTDVGGGHAVRYLDVITGYLRHLRHAQTTSAEVARNISLHWIETLYARDEQGNPIPDLAQKCDISADGKTYTFTLRQGVRFHNGQEMGAQDVKASMERYGKVGGSAAIMRPVDSITAASKYVVRVVLKTPVPGFIDQISSPRAPLGIMPASEGDKERNKISHIGTGPYQFVEFKPDSHVLLKRFDGYSSNGNFTKRDGFSGKKTAYFNSVTFRHIPEGGARAAALETGEIHAVDMLPPPAADRLKTNKSVKIYPVMPWAFRRTESDTFFKKMAELLKDKS